VPIRTLVIAAAAVGVVLIGGLALLAAWDIPAPTSRIERVIPNDRLPR
jgi:hypothetical protein